jgi:5-methylcytosine-specific restriction endonuclease McrA
MELSKSCSADRLMRGHETDSLRARYHKLWEEILKRDGWRCQHRGSLKNLQVHHMQPEGLLGNDEANNLITLCYDCHERLHFHVS